MSNIRMSQDEIMKLQQRIASDPVLIKIYESMASLHQKSMPEYTIVVTENKTTCAMKYSDEVEKALKFLEQERDQHLKTSYPDIAHLFKN